MSYTSASRRAFSLIELVIVVVIIGIIAAIAVPRMSRGAAGAGDAALVSNLNILRNGIELYKVEHNETYPTVTGFVDQLTGFSTEAGVAVPFATGRSDTNFLGPYIKTVPPLPVKPNVGATTVAAAPAANVGWIYDQATGVITANSTDKDVKGRAYNTY